MSQIAVICYSSCWRGGVWFKSIVEAKRNPSRVSFFWFSRQIPTRRMIPLNSTRGKQFFHLTRARNSLFVTLISRARAARGITVLSLAPRSNEHQPYHGRYMGAWLWSFSRVCFFVFASKPWRFDKFAVWMCSELESTHLGMLRARAQNPLSTIHQTSR